MKYDKLIAEKCVEDASEYICLRWEVRSVLAVPNTSLHFRKLSDLSRITV